MRAMTLGFALAAVLALPFAAQEKKLAFEVASVKRNIDGAGFGGGPAISGPTPTGYRATNATLPMLMFHAYGFDRQRILGGPGWVESQRYDVAATAGRQVSSVEAYGMLRTLLRDFAQRPAIRSEGGS